MKLVFFSGIFLAIVFSFPWLSGCQGRSIGLSDHEDADAIALKEDSGIQQDAESGDDGGLYWCSCPSGPDTNPDEPAYQYHSCVEPLKIGCKADVCNPAEPKCPEGHSCEECGAAACCFCAACVPACLHTEPTQGPLPEYLKISDPRGIAGQETTISIEGHPFYIGALGYSVRLGDLDLTPYVTGGSVCSIEITVPDSLPTPEVGIQPVWVSGYGYGTGDQGEWVLAGFFSWVEDPNHWEGCVQPGYPCPSDTSCCETTDVPMECREKRCRMKL